MLNIREAANGDEAAIWDIFSNVIQTGDTHVFDPNTPRSALASHWLAPNMQTFVAEENGVILGSYFIKANQIDLGSHIANAGYIVHPKSQGRGIGSAMCEHSIAAAKAAGFRAMQFNIVVSTNSAAVALWKKFGFKIIGTTPRGFRHKTLGFVDTYIMYLDLNV